MSKTAMLGAGLMDARVIDNEVYINANDLAALVTGAALLLAAQYIENPNETMRGQLQALVELGEQTDALRSHLLPDAI